MILVEMGLVPSETLQTVVRKQIEEIVYDLLAWEEGFFNFELGEIAPKDKIEIDTQEFLLKSGISAEYLLMEGTRILDERERAGKPPRPGAPAPDPSAASLSPSTASPPHLSYEPAKGNSAPASRPKRRRVSSRRFGPCSMNFAFPRRPPRSPC
jgi:hypothetical protein